MIKQMNIHNYADFYIYTCKCAELKIALRGGTVIFSWAGISKPVHKYLNYTCTQIQIQKTVHEYKPCSHAFGKEWDKEHYVIYRS